MKRTQKNIFTQYMQNISQVVILIGKNIGVPAVLSGRN